MEAISACISTRYHQGKFYSRSYFLLSPFPIFEVGEREGQKYGFTNYNSPDAASF